MGRASLGRFLAHQRYSATSHPVQQGPGCWCDPPRVVAHGRPAGGRDPTGGARSGGRPSGVCEFRGLWLGQFPPAQAPLALPPATAVAVVGRGGGRIGTLVVVRSGAAVTVGPALRDGAAGTPAVQEVSPVLPVTRRLGNIRRFIPKLFPTNLGTKRWISGAARFHECVPRRSSWNCPLRTRPTDRASYRPPTQSSVVRDCVQVHGARTSDDEAGSGRFGGPALGCQRRSDAAR